jgi:hypothetical protein
MDYPLNLRALLLWGIAVTLALVLPCVPAQAQSNGDGSIYSRYGLGTLTEFSSSQSAALGGGGYAIRSLNYNPTANPALWSDQVFTRLSAGASYQRVAASSGAGQSSLLTSGNIEAFQLSFPLYRRTLGVGLTFQPYTQHNYRLRSRDSLAVGSGPNAPDVPYNRDFRGQGGLYSFRGGLGYRINETVSVGASVDVLFGIVESVRSTSFGNTSIRTVTVSDGTRLVGVTGTFGGHFSFADVLQDDDALSVGAVAALPTTLTGTRTLTRGEGQDLVPDTLASADGEVTLPFRGRLGVAYQPSGRWTFTADGLYEPWSTFGSTFGQTSRFSGPFPVGGEAALTDRWRVSLGAEVLPGATDPLSGFLSNVAYRLGAYTERLYVQPDGATALRTYAVTGGFSFPTALSGTRIDLTLEAGSRGTTEGNFVRDTFFGVGLHVNFGERWFRERKLR